MAVVVNEMEVAPQPEVLSTAEGRQGNAAPGAKDQTKVVEERLQMRRARLHRLEAY